MFEVQLSPKKALRAAMLKSRFADTILRAQQKTLLEHVMPLIFRRGEDEKFVFSIEWSEIFN